MPFSDSVGSKTEFFLNLATHRISGRETTLNNYKKQYVSANNAIMHQLNGAALLSCFANTQYRTGLNLTTFHMYFFSKLRAPRFFELLCGSRTNDVCHQ